jgi:hypothetical protein
VSEKTLSISPPISVTELSLGLIFALTAVLAFFIPFSFGQPQWLVGLIVNTCLFSAATFLPKKYFILLSVLPSLGVVARGVIFGPLTVFLVYFLPFIWLGNFILMFIFSNLFSKIGYLYSMVVSAGIKFLFLFLIANAYFMLAIVPAIFLNVMGFFQLLTALGGGLISFLIFKSYGKFKQGNDRIS